MCCLGFHGVHVFRFVVVFCGFMFYINRFVLHLHRVPQVNRLEIYCSLCGGAM